MLGKYWRFLWMLYHFQNGWILIFSIEGGVQIQISNKYNMLFKAIRHIKQVHWHLKQMNWWKAKDYYIESPFYSNECCVIFDVKWTILHFLLILQFAQNYEVAIKKTKFIYHTFINSIYLMLGHSLLTIIMISSKACHN